MKQGIYRFKMLPIAFGIATMAMTPAIWAADAAPSAPAASGIEEVIITARKTEESQQVVPVSVTALSAEGLQKKVVLSVQDLQSAVPGLLIAPNSQGGAPTFAIRGAKADNGTSPTVAVYIDDVPVASTLSVANMVYDMQSVTTLKGPQGTLFGANSTGGAIIFRPNQPSNIFEGYGEAGIGNYGRQEVQGMINIPVNDMLQLRFAGEMVKRDGFERNNAVAGSKFNGITEYDNDKHESLRAGIMLKATDWSNYLLLDYFHKDQQPNQALAVANVPGGSPYATFLGFSVPLNYPGQPGWKAPMSISAAWKMRNQMTLSPDPTWDKGTWWGAEDTLSFQLSDNAALKNVLGYRNDKTNTSEQNGGEVNTAVDGVTQYTQTQWTDELSLDLSSDDKRLRNKVGLYLSRSKIQAVNDYTVIGLPFQNPPAIVASFYPIQSNSLYHRQFQEHAIYDQISYDLTKELTATLGLRYSWDRGQYVAKNGTGLGSVKNGYLYGTASVVPCAVGTVSAYQNYNATDCTGTQSLKSQAPSFNFTIEDKYAEKSMIYASIRGGYLIGGFNNQVTDPKAQVFKPEKVVDFETGIKSDWELWGRPIRTNAAVFYGNYSNQQRVQDGITPQGTTYIAVANAGASSYQGVDLDVTYEITDNLEANVGYTHVDATYSNFQAPLNIPNVTAFVDFAGHPVSQTPKDTWTASLTAKWPLSSDHGKLSSTLSYFWRDITDGHDAPTITGPVGANGQLTAITADYTQWDHLPAYSLVNFSTDWKSVMGSSFDAQFWVKNLFDKAYVIYNSNQMLTYGYATYSFGNPREIGLNVRYNF